MFYKDSVCLKHILFLDNYLYLSKYLNINENINSKFEAIKNSDTKNIKDNVKSLSDALSLEVEDHNFYLIT